MKLATHETVIEPFVPLPVVLIRLVLGSPDAKPITSLFLMCTFSAQPPPLGAVPYPAEQSGAYGSRQSRKPALQRATPTTAEVRQVPTSSS